MVPTCKCVRENDLDTCLPLTRMMHAEVNEQRGVITFCQRLAARSGFREDAH